MKKQSIKKRWIFALVGIVCVGLVIGLIPFVKYWISLSAPQKLIAVPKASTEVKWTEESIDSYSNDTVLEAYQHLDDLSVVGEVSIPTALGLHLPILEGLTNWNSVVGAVTMKPDQKMGHRNYVIGSHRLMNPYALFSPLNHTAIGDSIYLTDGQAYYEYICYYSSKVGTWDGYLMDDDISKERGVPVVTLLTCGNQAGTVRYAVQGELKNKWLASEAPVSVKDQFKTDMNWLDIATRWAVYWEIGDDGSAKN